MIRVGDLPSDWDLVIVGGGITGAGIFREAARMKLRVLLVEQKDFAWGTSSRSSKLVHGGLRYLKQKKLWLTRASVRERERMLKEAPGLVDPLEFLFPVYEGCRPSKWEMEAGLSVYSLLARERQHTFLAAHDVRKKLPGILAEGLSGGFRFVDGQTDDARLVLRLLQEGRHEGGFACNYTKALSVLRHRNGTVAGCVLEDTESGRQKEIRTPAVISAIGAWAETLQPFPDKGTGIRPLRGSHLVIPAHRMQLDRAVSLVHPADNRPIFILPWEGAVLLGTTDVDHGEELSREPFITPQEVDYLLEGVNTYFAQEAIQRKDCVACFAGVRPVLGDGRRAPSEESREHAVWAQKGLATVTGGKLTTFRLLAWDALEAVKRYLPKKRLRGRGAVVFPDYQVPKSIRRIHPAGRLRRWYGRYGREATDMLKQKDGEEIADIPGTRSSWAELTHAAGNEMVIHLEDLLLRRVRMGLLLPDGGRGYLEKIERICEPRLNWGAEKWAHEKKAYGELWERAYRVPGTGRKTK